MVMIVVVIDLPESMESLVHPPFHLRLDSGFGFSADLELSTDVGIGSVIQVSCIEIRNGVNVDQFVLVVVVVVVGSTVMWHVP
jgi:hypothetical protein